MLHPNIRIHYLIGWLSYKPSISSKDCLTTEPFDQSKEKKNYGKGFQHMLSIITVLPFH